MVYIYKFRTHFSPTLLFCKYFKQIYLYTFKSGNTMYYTCQNNYMYKLFRTPSMSKWF